MAMSTLTQCSRTSDDKHSGFFFIICMFMLKHLDPADGGQERCLSVHEKLVQLQRDSPIKGSRECFYWQFTVIQSDDVFRGLQRKL